MATKQGRREDRNIQSFSEIDLKRSGIVSVAFYKNHDDYPGKYIARAFNENGATNIVMAKDTWAEVVDDVKSNTDFAFRIKTMKGVPSLLGVWM